MNKYFSTFFSSFAILFILVNFLLTLFFIEPMGANAKSRALPVISLIESQEFNIDKTHQYTIDKAFINGHYYTDKAPLTTLITLATSYFLYPHHASLERKISVIEAIGTFFCSTLPFLIFMFFLLFVSSNNNKSRFIQNSLPIMLLCYGSNLFIYANGLWGHLLAMLLLVFSLHYLVKLRKFFYSGVFLALAINAEYTIAVIAISWFLILLFLKGFAHKKDIVLWLLGLLIPLLPLMFYHYHFTGNPFKPLYFFVATDEFKEMKNWLGISLPNLIVTIKLLFSPYRGLFFYSPPLLSICFLVLKKIKVTKSHFTFIFVIYAAFALIIFNSSYYMWFGGWCHGPRHLIPVIGLLYYLFAILIRDNTFSIHSRYLIGLSLIGVTGNILSKSVGTIYSQNINNPFREYLIPQFLDNNLPSRNFLFSSLISDTLWLPFLWSIMLFIFFLFWLKQQKQKDT